MSPQGPDSGDEKRRLWQLAGLGMEFAGGAIGMGAIGYAIDWKFGTQPWGVALGTLAGVSGGMYLLIRNALQAQKDAIRRQRNERKDHQ